MKRPRQDFSQMQLEYTLAMNAAGAFENKSYASSNDNEK